MRQYLIIFLSLICFAAIAQQPIKNFERAQTKFDIPIARVPIVKNGDTTYYQVYGSLQGLLDSVGIAIPITDSLNQRGNALRSSDSLFYRQCPTCPFNFVTKVDTSNVNEFGVPRFSNDSLYYKACPTCSETFYGKVRHYADPDSVIGNEYGTLFKGDPTEIKYTPCDTCAEQVISDNYIIVDDQGGGQFEWIIPEGGGSILLDTTSTIMGLVSQYDIGGGNYHLKVRIPDRDSLNERGIPRLSNDSIFYKSGPNAVEFFVGKIIHPVNLDNDSLNEIQYLDTAILVGNNLILSVYKDGRPASSINISSIDTDNQNLSNGGKVGNNQTINISGGTPVAFSVADADSSKANELITSFTRVADSIKITDAGGTYAVYAPTSGGGTVTNVTASSPLASSGGTTPNLTIQNATTSLTGALTSTDWNTFNNKVGGSGTAGYYGRFSSTSTIGNAGLYQPIGSNPIGIGTTSPQSYLINSSANGLAIYDATNPNFSLAKASNFWLHYMDASNFYRLFNSSGGEILHLTPAGMVSAYKFSYRYGSASNASGLVGYAINGADKELKSISVSTGLNLTTGGVLTNTSPDQTVSITGAGISNVTGTYPNFTVTSTEVDGSTTNEIQQIDTFTIVSNVLRASLSSDGVPFKSVNLSTYLDNTDAQSIDSLGFSATNTLGGSLSNDATVKTTSLRRYEHHLNSSEAEKSDNIVFIGDVEVASAAETDLRDKGVSVFRYDPDNVTLLGGSIKVDGFAGLNAVVRISPTDSISIQHYGKNLNIYARGTTDSVRVRSYDADTSFSYSFVSNAKSTIEYTNATSFVGKTPTYDKLWTSIIKADSELFIHGIIVVGYTNLIDQAKTAINLDSLYAARWEDGWNQVVLVPNPATDTVGLKQIIARNIEGTVITNNETLVRDALNKDWTAMRLTTNFNTYQRSVNEVLEDCLNENSNVYDGVTAVKNGMVFLKEGNKRYYLKRGEITGTDTLSIDGTNIYNSNGKIYNTFRTVELDSAFLSIGSETDYTVFEIGDGTSTYQQIEAYVNNDDFSKTAFMKLTDTEASIGRTGSTITLADSTSFNLSGSTGTAGQVATATGTGKLKWQSLPSGTVGGSGTSGYFPYFSAASTLSDSPLYRLSSTSMALGTTTNTNLGGRAGFNIMSADPAFVIGKSTSHYWYHYMNGNNYEVYNPNFGAVLLLQTDGKIKAPKYNGSGNRYLYASSTGEVNVSTVDAVSGSGTGGYVSRWFSAGVQDNSGLYNTPAGGGVFGIGTTTPASYLVADNGLAISGTTPAFSLRNTSGFYASYLSGADYRMFNSVNGEVFSIKAGKFGINQTNPTYRLDVVGDIKATDFTGGSLASYLGRDASGQIIDATAPTSVTYVQTTPSTGIRTADAGTATGSNPVAFSFTGGSIGYSAG